MAMGEHRTAAPILRMETLSYPSRAKSSRAVSRIRSRNGRRERRVGGSTRLFFVRSIGSSCFMFTLYTAGVKRKLAAARGNLRTTAGGIPAPRSDPTKDFHALIIVPEIT